MSVTLAGKCRPEAKALDELREVGFDTIELQLLPEHLDAFDRSLAAAKRSDLDVASVHTPHVSLEETECFSLADAFADELDARLVVHSQYVQHVHIPDLETLGFDAEYAYENNPGSSSYHLEHAILGRGHDLVLDTAHLYTAERGYLSALETLLRNHADDIPVVHLSDSTPRRDGLPFGDGDVDLHRTSRVLKRFYDGLLVLEVHPPAAQAAAREAFLAY